MSELRTEYVVEWYCSHLDRWCRDGHIYRTIDEARCYSEHEHRLYPKDKHRIVSRRISDWEEVNCVARRWCRAFNRKLRDYFGGLITRFAIAEKGAEK